MHGTEMSTAANYNIPVTFIVFNNGRLDMVDKGMKYHQRWRGVSEMNKDYEKGIDILKQMTDDEGMQTIKYLQDIFPDFEEKIVAFGFGQIYSRPNLELKLREVVTITALITQGLFDQLDFHIKAALKVGLKQQEILEIILHCAAYVGFPKACSALVIVGKLFKNNTK